MSIATSCKIQNCDRLGQLINGKRYFTKGYCKSHYRKHLLGVNLYEPYMGDSRPAIIDGNIAKIPLGVGSKQGYSIVDSRYAYLADKYHFYIDGNGYAVSRIQNSRILLHHLIIGRPEKGMYVDHINRDRLDNRAENLRVVTMQQNNFNRRKNSNGACKYKGVFFSKGKYWASIAKSGMVKRRSFTDEISAAKQYNTWASELFGEYAYINEIA